MTITVTHVRNGRSSLAATVYVGRPSPLGNPFILGKHGNRQQVVSKYDDWLRRLIKDEDSPQARKIAELRRLAQQGDLDLACYCAPLACHADVIKRVIEE